MGRHTRKSEINRRRARRTKLKTLRRKYAAAKNDGERSKLVEKLRLVSRSLTADFFTAAAAPSAEKG